MHSKWFQEVCETSMLNQLLRFQNEIKWNIFFGNFVPINIISCNKNKHFSGWPNLEGAQTVLVHLPRCESFGSAKAQQLRIYMFLLPEWIVHVNFIHCLVVCRFEICLNPSASIQQLGFLAVNTEFPESSGYKAVIDTNRWIVFSKGFMSDRMVDRRCFLPVVLHIWHFDETYDTLQASDGTAGKSN